MQPVPPRSYPFTYGYAPVDRALSYMGVSATNSYITAQNMADLRRSIDSYRHEARQYSMATLYQLGSLRRLSSEMLAEISELPYALTVFSNLKFGSKDLVYGAEVTEQSGVNVGVGVGISWSGVVKFNSGWIANPARWAWDGIAAITPIPLGGRFSILSKARNLLPSMKTLVRSGQ